MLNGNFDEVVAEARRWITRSERSYDTGFAEVLAECIRECQDQAKRAEMLELQERLEAKMNQTPSLSFLGSSARNI